MDEVFGVGLKSRGPTAVALVKAFQLNLFNLGRVELEKKRKCFAHILKYF